MAERYTPEHLERWTLPDCYYGAEWPEYFVGPVGRNRDSDCGVESNFEVASAELLKLGDEYDSVSGRDDCSVQIVRENHWAVGWIEWIAIHQDNAEALKAADRMAADLEGYPILDEEDFCERELEECSRVWADCYDTAERLQYLRDHANTEYAESWGSLRAAVNGEWGEACRILPCPTDLIY